MRCVWPLEASYIGADEGFDQSRREHARGKIQVSATGTSQRDYRVPRIPPGPRSGEPPLSGAVKWKEHTLLPVPLHVALFSVGHQIEVLLPVSGPFSRKRVFGQGHQASSFIAARNSSSSGVATLLANVSSFMCVLLLLRLIGLSLGSFQKSGLVRWRAVHVDNYLKISSDLPPEPSPELAAIWDGDQDKVYLLSEREPYRRRIETPKRKRSFRRKLAITFETKREA